MIWIERKLVKKMVQSLLERMFSHWKSSTTGVVIAVGAFTVMAQTYHAGMSWKQWLIAAVPAVVGFILKDPQPKQ
jgi:hypothetical protein